MATEKKKGDFHGASGRIGDVVGTIAVAAMRADLLAMPTAGRQGLGDILRGSTTERVLRDAPCPVLALPARD